MSQVLFELESIVRPGAQTCMGAVDGQSHDHPKICGMPCLAPLGARRATAETTTRMVSGSSSGASAGLHLVRNGDAPSERLTGMVHLVSFSFPKKNDTKANRDRIESAIKKWLWARISSTVWMVSVECNAATLRDELWPHMTEGDKLFITRVTGEWGSYNLESDVVQWLNTVNYD